MQYIDVYVETFSLGRSVASFQVLSFRTFVHRGKRIEIPIEMFIINILFSNIVKIIFIIFKF